jgi:NTP pyrophosphatase (non-canonical NTP hydrolase)
MLYRLDRYDSFVDEKWFVGDSDLGGLPEEAYLGICIAGEAGEVAEKLKKAYRDSGGRVDRLAMCRELGDVAYYLTRYAHRLGYTLAQVLDENVAKLNDRESRGVLRGSGDRR